MMSKIITHDVQIQVVNNQLLNEVMAKPTLYE